ncbi:hypothetical protein NDI76_08010 [Halogeometricum sp. S1BR25-6]|uniref:DUF7511 domain-containing protein n=1 Tax=Halogeometricum salsisoli TaxID=2950536 RepID=A0ABU2GEE0_9EURY|nr:hypothetical protein [Halogeometricum sp. S1BR25-6]MDS0298684.1 hypothetical protein [Halogeometricum sp. S1BR25-6]
MSDPSAGPDGTPEARDITGADVDRSVDVDGRKFELHSVVVTYEDDPDRCTVYPRRNRCLERVEAWLSADFDAFVDLGEMR